MKLQIWIGIAALAFVAGGCKQKPAETSPAAEVVEVNPGEFTVAHPERFALAAVVTRQQPHVLQVNASVVAEASRTVQVISPYPGRLVETSVQPGDTVTAGEVLAVVRSPDLQQALSDLQTAEADEKLARAQLARDRDLQSHGALPAQTVEIADNAEADALAHLDAARQKLRVWGDDAETGGDSFAVRAPRAGLILAQNAAAGTVVPTSDNSAALFTLADLAQVWLLCDVYENDLAQVAVGDSADVELASLPGRTFHGVVSDVPGVLDPATRTAKVRVVLENPAGIFKPGMFANVRLISHDSTAMLLVPQDAVVRSEDRNFVYLSLGAGRFRKLEVQAGSVILDAAGQNRWIPVTGALHAGDRLVAQALQFESDALAAGEGN